MIFYPKHVAFKKLTFPCLVLLPSPHHPFLRCLKLSRCTKLHSDVPDLNVGRSVFLLSFLSGSIHSQVSGTWVEPSGIFAANSNLHFLNCFLYFLQFLFLLGSIYSERNLCGAIRHFRGFQFPVPSQGLTRRAYQSTA